MRSRLVWASLVVVAGIAVFASAVPATPPSGVTPTEFGIGKFGSIDTNGRIGAWRATMNIKGATDLHVLSNTIAPGGSLRVAQPSRAELRDHQVGDGDGLSGR